MNIGPAYVLISSKTVRVITMKDLEITIIDDIRTPILIAHDGVTTNIQSN
jgi:hypothetical protein